MQLHRWFGRPPGATQDFDLWGPGHRGGHTHHSGLHRRLSSEAAPPSLANLESVATGVFVEQLCRSGATYQHRAQIWSVFIQRVLL